MAQEEVTSDISFLVDLMEKMAGEPREKYGKRQPGERGKYETWTDKDNRTDQ